MPGSGASLNLTKSGALVNKILMPVSTGELFDRLTILEIKRARIRDGERRANVSHELQAVGEVVRSLGEVPLVSGQLRQLRLVNSQLWDAESNLRAWERMREFDAGFVADARAVYTLNDRRSELKRSISVAMGSAWLDEKDYG